MIINKVEETLKERHLTADWLTNELLKIGFALTYEQMKKIRYNRREIRVRELIAIAKVLNIQNPITLIEHGTK